MQIGDAVRIYYDQDTFDEGEIIALTTDFIDVDFYDWIERWNSLDSFVEQQSYFESITFLQVLLPGEIIADFRQSTQV